MRLFAAVGIVWMHAAGSAQGQMLFPLGTFGVPFYTLVAVLFMARGLSRDTELPLSRYIASRFQRIYIPFLFWSLIYVLLAEAKLIVTDQTMQLPHWSTLYAGGQQHLWFLPYLMVVTIVGALLVRGLMNAARLRYLAIALLIVGGTVLAALPEPAWVAHRVQDRELWSFALRGLPTACWAIAIALAFCVGGRLPRTPGWLAIVGSVVLVCTLAAQPFFGATSFIRGLCGLGCLCIALYPMRSSGLEWIGVLGRHSFGIYLSHVLFLRVIAVWTQRYDIAPSLSLDVMSFVIALSGGLILSMLLSRSRWKRWTLGE